jgi:DNA polymerase V
MSYFILADCNNFYVACEALFDPSIEGKPVVVLSQNDGCIISRSQEAKRLGIRMGEPYFKVKEFCQRVKVIVFSSNYRLYGDMSERVMNVLTQSAPEIEIYSIDEAFMKFPKILSAEEILKEGLEIKKRVKKWVGIPLSIGIAPTKTLAKVANSLAKKNREVGIFSLLCPHLREDVLKQYPTEDIWGIGPGYSQRLKEIGVFTAWEFTQKDPHLIRKKMGVVGERIFWELKGIETLDLQKIQPRKNLTFTRSFGRMITEISDLSEALSTFASKACVRLRNQKSLASACQVYLETASYEGERMIRKSYGMIASFLRPTQDTSQIISAAKSCLQKLYIERETYKKCGIFLLDLIPEEQSIPDLFLEEIDPKRSALMHTVDALNERFGKDSVFFGAMGTKERWKPGSKQRSEHTTTSWDELPIVYAKKF